MTDNCGSNMLKCTSRNRQRFSCPPMGHINSWGWNTQLCHMERKGSRVLIPTPSLRLKGFFLKNKPPYSSKSHELHRPYSAPAYARFLRNRCHWRGVELSALEQVKTIRAADSVQGERARGMMIKSTWNLRHEPAELPESNSLPTQRDWRTGGTLRQRERRDRMLRVERVTRRTLNCCDAPSHTDGALTPPFPNLGCSLDGPASCCPLVPSHPCFPLSRRGCFPLSPASCTPRPPGFRTSTATGTRSNGNSLRRRGACASPSPRPAGGCSSSRRASEEAGRARKTSLPSMPLAAPVPSPAAEALSVCICVLEVGAAVMGCA